MEIYDKISISKNVLVFQTTWIVTWPIHLVFLFTIPDCTQPRFRKWFPVTFMMCIVWIGSLSYVVAWMITIIGNDLPLATFKCYFSQLATIIL